MVSPKETASDLRLVVTRMRRQPAFAVAALLILTLGIGANTAVFSIVNGVLLQPLAYGHADRLVDIQEVVPQFVKIAPTLPVNARHWEEWKRRCTSFDDVALMDGREFNLTGQGDPERIPSARVSTNFFSVLGVQAQAGRVFVPEDGVKGKDGVVVITSSLWRRRFGGSPAAIGQFITLDGKPHLVIGVLPETFRHHFHRGAGRTQGDHATELYKPWPVVGSDWSWLGDFNYVAVARLKPGVDAGKAAAELNVLQAEIATRFEDSGKLDLKAVLTPLQEQVVASSRKGLLLLLAAVAAVLLIACLNLGNLMLVRARGRRREMAIRAALGASRGKLIGGLLGESLSLSFSGALLGVLPAVAMVRVFRLYVPSGLPRVDEVGVDWRAMLFAAALALVSAMLFGLFPAWRLRNMDPQEALRPGGRSQTEGGEGVRFRQWLVAAEVGLSAALLIVAGLLVASALRLGAVDPGFRAANVLTAEVSLPAVRYAAEDKRRQFYDEAVRRLNEQPGMKDASVISVLPLQGQMWSDTVTREGETRPLGERPILSYRPASDGDAAAMGIPLRAGRMMATSDFPRRTVVMSEQAAARIWPGENPIGKRFWRSNPKEQPFEVVGIVGDVRGEDLSKQGEPLIYVPLWVRAPSTVVFAVKTAVGPESAAAAMRRVIWSMDAQLPVSRVRTMESIERDSTAQRRFQTLLVTVFATIALLLAALGTYSVLAYSVTQRTQEIGIRMALGAQRRDVLAMVMRQGLWPVAVGLAAGLITALAAGSVLSSLLYGVSAQDTATYATVAALTLATATLACWIPAWRAGRVPPLEALRYE
ncbi:MAG: ABC transporter permease [Acidobacteria bacterium]|nr:ABC transporter permease [Acidobacteriota bacterium]